MKPVLWHDIDVMPDDALQGRARLDRHGRIVIPSAFRKKLGLRLDQELVLWEENGKLVVETEANVCARLQGLFAHVPSDVSLADELIAERRDEARREMKRMGGDAPSGAGHRPMTSLPAKPGNKASTAMKRMPQGGPTPKRSAAPRG